MTDRSASDIVRDYLTYLKDPDSYVRNGVVARLRAKLDGEDDVLARLRILSALDVVLQSCGEVLREEFIAVASRYASEEGVTPTAFQKSGVPQEVLIEAGLIENESSWVDLREPAVPEALVEPSAAHPEMVSPRTVTHVARAGVGSVLVEAGPVTEKSSPVPGSSNDDNDGLGRVKGAAARRPRTAMADIVAMIPSEPFTLKQLTELSGAAMLTVRKAVQALQDEKKLVCVGQDQTHSGPGRAPMLFRLATA